MKNAVEYFCMDIKNEALFTFESNQKATVVTCVPVS